MGLPRRLLCAALDYPFGSPWCTISVVTRTTGSSDFSRTRARAAAALGTPRTPLYPPSDNSPGSPSSFTVLPLHAALDRPSPLQRHFTSPTLLHLLLFLLRLRPLRLLGPLRPPSIPSTHQPLRLLRFSLPPLRPSRLRHFPPLWHSLRPLCPFQPHHLHRP